MYYFERFKRKLLFQFPCSAEWQPAAFFARRCRITAALCVFYGRHTGGSDEKTILKNPRGGKDEKLYRKADGVLKLFDKSGKLIQEIKM